MNIKWQNGQVSTMTCCRMKIYESERKCWWCRRRNRDQRRPSSSASVCHNMFVFSVRKIHKKQGWASESEFECGLLKTLQTKTVFIKSSDDVQILQTLRWAMASKPEEGKPQLGWRSMQEAKWRQQFAKRVPAWAQPESEVGEVMQTDDIQK